MGKSTVLCALITGLGSSMATEMLGAIFACHMMLLLHRCVKNVVLFTNGVCYVWKSCRNLNICQIWC